MTRKQVECSAGRGAIFMEKRQGVHRKVNLNPFANFQRDIPAGIVVFLVAIPLCLGIALASGAPLFAGLLSGILGGLIIPLISRSPLSVSGPAAGLIAIVIAGIDQAGSWEAFLVAVFLGGVLQVALGLFKAGRIAYFFPNSVIKGMLAAIGLILIRKQLPHAFGLDIEAFDEEFHLFDTAAVFREILVQGHYEVGAAIIAVVSLGILILWDQTKLKTITWLPAALVVVIAGVLLNQLFGLLDNGWQLQGESFTMDGTLTEPGHLVALPQSLVNSGFRGFLSEIRFPDWSALANPAIYGAALTIGLVASVETLLSVEAVDKLDPHKRQTPLNLELIAQGIANILAGLLGALPITAVIVRSSANVNSGGQTRMAAFVHGLILLLSAVSIGVILNLIPLASLAAILLMIGYKLANPTLFRAMYRDGINQFLPFVVTVVAVLVTDLLIGITIGAAVGIFFTIRANFHQSITFEEVEDGYLLRFQKDVSFLNKAILSEALAKVPPGSKVTIDGSQATFIDHDIQEIISEFNTRAEEMEIELVIIGVKPEDARVPVLR